MTAINRGELLPLDVGFLGRPFAPITSSNSDPAPDIGFMGRPFTVAPTGAVVTPPTVAARPVIFTVSG